LLREIEQNRRKQYYTLLKNLLPKKLIPVCIEQTGIAYEKKVDRITAEERKRLRLWLKDFRFDIIGHRGFDEAIITSGGISLKEIDPRTMASRLIKGLHFAGEILDLDGATGGYNLQAAFSTGYLAGQAAMK
jgi:predicted Rossmann fold flavoprotein